jgi:hypothetical protein
MRWFFGKGRTRGTADRCEYVGGCSCPRCQKAGRLRDHPRCTGGGAGELRGHSLDWRNGVPWTMCAEHVKPGHHPADLRDKLVTW